MRKVLKDQMEEKLKIKQIDKEEDMKYYEIVKINAKKFEEDKESVIKNHYEKINKYKNELDKQLNAKQKNRYMNENEREYNSKLMQKIYNEIEDF
jgi:hypothetical protein